ncbi:hypothetical protein DESC_780493 [Desulfosarcina cetonica]|nr:hypothetical protein DESC_780493 [Desulfosarcina cetonica]
MYAVLRFRSPSGVNLHSRKRTVASMEFTFAHNTINIVNLPKSLAFYQQAPGLKEVRR